MEAKINFKNRLPSRHVTEGPARAPHRSCCRAMGLADEQAHQRFVGVASCVTRNGIENAAAGVAASGGSTNAALHLPAIAHECGIAFDLFDIPEIFKRTPYIADLKPAGRFVAKDLFEAAGVPLLMKTLLDNGFMHRECMTVTGYGMAENLKRVAGNFDREGPEVAVGGPIGLVRDGDIVAIDADHGSLEVQLSDVEFEKRQAAWQPRGSAFESGYLWEYAQQVGSARHGAVTHPGEAAEKACYADI